MKTALLALSAAALLAAGAAEAQPLQAAKDDANAIGHRVAQTGRATGHAVANGGREVGHATLQTGRDAEHGIKHAARTRHHRRHRHH